jgi:hypothetical protein
MKTQIKNLKLQALFWFMFISFLLGAYFDLFKHTYKGYIFFSILTVMFWFNYLLPHSKIGDSKKLKKENIWFLSITTIIAFLFFFGYNLFFEKNANNEFIGLVIFEAVLIICMFIYKNRIIKKIETLAK